jgi:hypothetical protein
MIYSRALKANFGDSILNLFGKQLSRRRVRTYAPEDTELEQLEIEAREAQRALWVDPHSVPPRD